eukprot:14691284-Ditylum_brightwellii.AAC.1
MHFVGLNAEDRMTTKQKTKAKQYYCSKEKHGKLYVQMKELFSEFTSRKHLEECHHKYDT